MASLRIKILLILVLFLCAVGSISFGVGAYLFHQSLVDFEQRATASQLARGETAVVQDVDALVARLRAAVRRVFPFWGGDT